MKTLGVLVLLSSAMLLCRTAPPLEPVTCGDNNGAAAARLAVHDINEHHDHGYKFRLSEIVGNNIEKVLETEMGKKLHVFLHKIV